MSSLTENPGDNLCPPSSYEDDTFVPTIDMIVNDFDDEQTLNEEEGLASLEMQNPQDEIAMLREEGEMPLDELLAKYQLKPPPKKLMLGSERKRIRRMGKHVVKISEAANATLDDADVSAIKHDDENVEKTPESIEIDDVLEENTQPLRTHLLELYPETFGTVTEDKEELEDEIHDDDDNTDDCDKESDGDFMKKTIMVGASFQADIPIGLSQYGDILPYENEDKLVWEPSQVSDDEVEAYLLKARDIKPTLSNNDLPQPIAGEETIQTDGPQIPGNTTSIPDSDDIADENLSVKNKNQISVTDREGIGVIKDNEQALHLLVQCGYDFKEALRRKSLNALPLTGSMSLWSEEECNKFEEGIQKYGKDFIKIRQNQVRTRTMRELVQFYYQWKKSGRRDQNFANSDTVDHMDIYLNAEGNYGTNNASSTTSLSCAPLNAVPETVTRKSSAGAQNIFSIMTGSILSSSTNNAEHAKASYKTCTNRKGAMASLAEVTLTNNVDKNI